MKTLFHVGFLEVQWIDLLDVLVVAFLIYQLYKFLSGSLALKIFIGLILLYLTYLVVKAAQMELLSSILGNFIGVGIIAVIILFQQEIRKFLLIAGRSAMTNNRNIFNFLMISKTSVDHKLNINPIIESSKILGGTNTGAIIVIARGSELRLYAETGDELDAVVSKRLLLSIFNKYSPLHDGAVIIVGNRIKAARCILPVTENNELPAFLGLRHRSAIGITELTDCVVLVVSEETGQLSIARDGKLYYNLSPLEVRFKLNLYLFGKEEDIKQETDESIDVLQIAQEID